MLVTLLLDPHWQGVGPTVLVLELAVLALAVGFGVHLWGRRIARRFDRDWTEEKARHAANGRRQRQALGCVLAVGALVAGLVGLVIWAS